MKRTPLARKSPIKRGGRVKPINPKRRQSEFARTYHSKARVAWVKAQPCLVRDCRGAPCENAHIETGGVGRKADADKIIPLCRDHHWQSHHYGWDALGSVWANVDYREMWAAKIDERWRRFAEGE